MERIHVRRRLRQVTDGRGWPTLANIVRAGDDGRPERVFMQEELFSPRGVPAGGGLSLPHGAAPPVQGADLPRPRQDAFRPAAAALRGGQRRGECALSAALGVWPRPPLLHIGCGCLRAPRAATGRPCVGADPHLAAGWKPSWKTPRTQRPRTRPPRSIPALWTCLNGPAAHSDPGRWADRSPGWSPGNHLRTRPAGAWKEAPSCVGQRLRRLPPP